ncbi:32895_t:CDS:2 [Racocetra persica]|uniref:32895_t:CDS:1 n=1 Tax=Racocetra persica TaxID=160502 RepID=A0ACA9N474_9GLOM|nr:32895_t:CDS:2 [Racocetra persica]
MNQDKLNFTLAAQLYNLRSHKQTSNSFNSDTTATSTEDINDDLNKSSNDENTIHNTQTWVNAIKKYFKDTNLTGDITQIKDYSELENILIQFFVALKRKDDKPYTSTSIYNYKTLKITIPREKNHAGGLKNLSNAGQILQKAFGFMMLDLDDICIKR